MRYVLILAVLAALVVGFLALGWKDALFGDRDDAVTAVDPGSPAPVDTAPGAGPAPAGDEAGAGGRRLFGRAPADLRGVGAVTARVLRYGDSAPVAGARVSLRGTGHGGEAVAGETTTNDAGAASLDAVAAGEGYALRVDVAGEPPQERPDLRVVAGRTSDGGVFHVGARAALEGKVVDEEGRGVARAAVLVHRSDRSWADLLQDFEERLSALDREPKPAATGETREDGAFRIEGLPPGEWTVVARAPGRLDGRETGTLGAKGLVSGPLVVVLGTGAAIAGRVVTPAGGGVPDARLAFFPEGASDPRDFLHGRVFASTGADGAFRAAVPDDANHVRVVVAAEGHPTHISARIAVGTTDARIVLPEAVEIDVRVVEKETGRAVEGARVTVAVQAERDGAAGTVTARTDAEGRATLVSPSGRLAMLLVSHPRLPGGLTSPELRRSAGLAQFGGTLDADAPDEVRAGAPNRIEVRLPAGIVVAGRVTDPSGRPVAGVEVSMGSVLPIRAPGPTAFSGSDGAYRLAGVLRAPSLVLRAKATGWTARAADMKVQGEPDAAGVLLHDVVLHPSSTLRGRVVDEAGAGVAGAKVTASIAGLAALASAGAPSATTGDDGSYVLFDAGDLGPFADMLAFAAPDSADARRLRVRAEREGYADGESDDLPLAEGRAIAVPPIRLRRGAVLRGVVLDPDGSPVPHARVEARIARRGEERTFSMPGLDRNHRRLTAGRDGRFELAGLLEGKVTATASRAGTAGAQRTVEVAGSGVATAELRLRPGREVRGRVVDSEGRGVSGASVLAQRLVGASGDDAYLAPATDASAGDGTFTLRALPPGRVELVARAEGHRDATAEAETGRGSVELVLSPRTASDEARRKEIDAQMAQALKEMQDATTDEARTAAAQRYTQLVTEKARLEGEAEGD